MTRALLLLALAVGCARDNRAPVVEAADSVTRGDPASATLIVGLHGMGGSPESFARVFDGFTGRAELVFIRGLVPEGSGWAWFAWPRGLSDAELASRIAGAATRVWTEITARAHGRRVIVTGFSQGAVLALALAATHPEIASAFPISGWLPQSAYPHARPAPVYAIHGEDDRIVPIDADRATIAAFVAAGGHAELHAVAGVAHQMPQAVRDDLLAHLAAVLP